MNSKTDLQRSTDLLNIPSSDFVKQAYAMAAELNTSSPDVSAMLRASAARIDVFNALVGTVASANVERYTPDYKMHLNHELAFMRPNPNGSWISLADYLTLLNEKNDLQKQVRALAVQWMFISESGTPSVPAGERAEFWVCSISENGKCYVAKRTWFNHVEPHEDDHDAIDNCEMSTPDGENYWPVGWHEEFASHDFEHFYEPSQLKVVAYAPYAAPEVPLSLRAGEVPNV